MTVSRLRTAGRPVVDSLGRAPLRRSTRALLLGLRVYAMLGVAVAVYSFFHALR